MNDNEMSVCPFNGSECLKEKCGVWIANVTKHYPSRYKPGATYYITLSGCAFVLGVVLQAPPPEPLPGKIAR